MNEELIPRVGDLVKMKIDGDRGQVGVVHKIRELDPVHSNLYDGLSYTTAAQHVDTPRGSRCYDITWPDVRSVQYLSEIRVISRS